MIWPAVAQHFFDKMKEFLEVVLVYFGSLLTAVQYAMGAISVHQPKNARTNHLI